MGNNYLIDSQNLELALQDMHETRIIEESLNELFFLLECVEKQEIVIEEVTTNNKDDDRGIFQKVVDFIRSLIDKFVNAARGLFQNNKGWFEENIHKFNDITDEAYGKLKITTIPYWKGNYKLLTPANLTPERVQATKDDNELAKLMYPNLVKLSVDGDLVSGAKIYFRGGSNNLESITGSNVKSTVKEMIRYCNNYSSETVDEIKTTLENLATDVEKSQEAIDKAVNESYSFLEGCLLEQTDLAFLPMVIVTEEGSTGEGDKNKDKDKDKPQAATVTNAADGKPGDKPAGEESDEEKKKKQEEKDKKVKGLERGKAAVNLKVKVATAAMTIAEERYYSYLKTLKAVLSSIPASDKPDNSGKK